MVARRVLRSAPLRYGFALLIVAIATALRYWLGELFGITLFFITYYPATMLVAVVVGGGPGVSATFLSAACADFFFMEPAGSFEISGRRRRISLALFTAMGLAVTALAGSMRRSKERYAALRETAVLDVISDAFFALDPAGRFTVVNPAAERAIARRREDLLGRAIWQCLPEAVGSSFQAAQSRALAERAAVHAEVSIPPSAAIYEMAVYPSTAGLSVYFRDISERLRLEDERQRAEAERQRAEAMFRESAERFRLLTQAVPSMTFECDPDGRRTFVSERWCAYTGMRPAETVGNGWLEAEHPDEVEDTRRLWDDAVGSGRPYELRHRLRAADGSFRWFLVRALPQIGADGRVLRWAGSCTDVDDLINADAALREAARRKDEFLAILAHELRNPLVPIRNAAHILGRVTHSEPWLLTTREMIDRQVTHLARLVDDLLDVSRIAQGKIRLQSERTDLARIARATAGDHRGRLDEAGLSLTVDVPAAPVMVEGDPTRLAQILGNLLDNARKFSDRGGTITVSLGVETAADGGDRAVLSVRDTGAGIAPEMLPRVFDAYAQADDTLSRNRGGLGLGLALVRGLAEQHGGGVEVASAGLGRGAEFRLWLPLAGSIEEPETATPGGAAEAPVSRPVRVLLIEDNPMVAESLRMLLSFEGHTVEVAHSGEAGVSVARDFHPRVVLCDVGLPGMSGFDVARALRSDASMTRPYLVALTGHGDDANKRAAKDAGFDEHLIKPIDIEQLMALLNEVGKRDAP